MVRGPAFTPDGQTLATACADGTVRLHDLVPGRTRHLVAGGEARRLAVSPDGQWLAAATRHEHPGGRVTCPVMVYRPATGELVAKIVHTAAVDRLAFSADSSLLATGSGDCRVRIHSTGDRVRRREPPHDHPVWASAFAPDGASLPATGTDTAPSRCGPCRTTDLPIGLVAHHAGLGSGNSRAHVRTAFGVSPAACRRAFGTGGLPGRGRGKGPSA